MLCRHHGSIPVWQVERDAGWRGHQHLSGVVGCGAGCLAILWDWQCQCGTQLLLVVNVWEVLVCPVTVVLDEDDCKIKTVCDGATGRGLASGFFCCCPYSHAGLLLPIQCCRQAASLSKTTNPIILGSSCCSWLLFRMQTFKDAATHIGLGVHLLSSNTAAWTTRWLS